MVKNELDGIQDGVKNIDVTDGVMIVRGAREEKGKVALLSKFRLSAEHEEKCREKWTQAFRLPRIEEGFLHS